VLWHEHQIIKQATALTVHFADPNEVRSHVYKASEIRAVITTNFSTKTKRRGHYK